jgi:hypothetical protein
MHFKMIRRPLSLSSSLSLLWLVLVSVTLPGSPAAVRADGTLRYAGLPAPALTRAPGAGQPGAGRSPLPCNVFWGERAPKSQRPVRRAR